MILLTPGQEAKHWRLQAQAKSLHATLQTFRDRRSDLRAQLAYIDQQVASEETRGKRISEDMRREIEVMKAPIARELEALAAEEAAITGQWREASRLMQALDKYAATLRRAN